MLAKIYYIYYKSAEFFIKNNENKLEKYYIPGFILFEDIVLEIKAERSFFPVDDVQIINSLKISKHKIGLLFNFGEQSLLFKRF